jgi:3-hydroxyacyl-[acyl-carrier-protein] dehydratase
MNDQTLPGPVDIARILDFLPHRYPFLLIDRVLSLEMEPEKRLIGLKNVTINEPYFQGHFPTNPVMPGVLIIEAMAQASGMLAHLAAETKGEKREVYYLVKVDKVKFNQTIVPGDQVILDVTQKRVMRNMGQYECKAFVDDRRVASCELLCAGKRA